MIKAFLSAGLIFGLCASAQAGPSAASKQGTSSAHDYWLSDGLNRLVFWRPAAAPPPGERKSAN